MFSFNLEFLAVLFLFFSQVSFFLILSLSVYFNFFRTAYFVFRRTACIHARFRSRHAGTHTSLMHVPRPFGFHLGFSFHVQSSTYIHTMKARAAAFPRGTIAQFFLLSLHPLGSSHPESCSTPKLIRVLRRRQAPSASVPQPLLVHHPNRAQPDEAATSALEASVSSLDFHHL